MSAAGPSFWLGLRPSRWLLAILGTGHGLAFGALFLADVHDLLRGSLALAVFLHGFVCWQRDYALQHPCSVTGLRWRAGAWSVRLCGSQWLPAELVGDCVVTLSLVLLRLHLPGRKTTVAVLILPDSADPDAIRRLRVRLRFGQREAAPQPE